MPDLPPQRKSYGIAKRKPTVAALFILARTGKEHAMLRLILGFMLIALPLIELALLIKTGQVLGFWPTFGLVVGAGLLGAFIISRQGWSVVRRAQSSLARGRPPVKPVIDGLFLVLAGALLMTPGFLSDFAALLLLIPPVRHGLARWGLRRLVQKAQLAGVNVFEARIAGQGGRDAPSEPSGGGPVIEGEFERLDEKARGPHRPSGRDRL
jgi:UPF0716 protein FxsA